MRSTAQLVAALLVVTHIVTVAFTFSLGLGECCLVHKSRTALSAVLMALLLALLLLLPQFMPLLFDVPWQDSCGVVCTIHHQSSSNISAQQMKQADPRKPYHDTTGAIPSRIARVVMIIMSSRMFFVRDMDSSVYQEIIMVWCFFVAAVDLFWAWAW